MKVIQTEKGWQKTPFVNVIEGNLSTGTLYFIPVEIHTAISSSLGPINHEKYKAGAFPMAAYIFWVTIRGHNLQQQQETKRN